ncbi:GNAT family N-acetyltransferase [Algoriphagus sp. AK58]|uniref:GNAT family N-acetyltransferase n=1 Tax=Algoriphagus sp. AK58 TaxID=1406877 RepID=UPI001650B924|nr:GNAT family N-acetyltransferase [Algoriphagus sp. AK58]MBC6366813.1 GNAT family N-acetyltransferase [Algoriphagus sp. AK58]
MKAIHPYQSSDLSDVLVIWKQSASLAYPFLNAEFFLKEERRISREYLPCCDTWICKDHLGRSLGFITLIGNEIGGLFVLPEFQNQGIGKKLVEFISGNFPILWVEVFLKNQKGICFYEKMGFSFFEEKAHEETGEILFRMVCRNS